MRDDKIGATVSQYVYYPPKMRYVVELGQGVWLGPLPGDPSLATSITSARRFAWLWVAENALRRARRRESFPLARVVELGETPLQVEPLK